MDLLKYLNKNLDKITESEKKQLTLKLVLAIKHCHDNDIMHRDIKPDNILVNLDKQGKLSELKLTDFGLACKISEAHEQKNTMAGSMGYMAPEILTHYT